MILGGRWMVQSKLKPIWKPASEGSIPSVSKKMISQCNNSANSEEGYYSTDSHNTDARREYQGNSNRYKHIHQIMPQEAPASIGGERNEADEIPVPMYSVPMPQLAIMII